MPGASERIGNFGVVGVAAALAQTHPQQRLGTHARACERVRAKALLRMRLRERSSDYDYTEVANALARTGH